MNLQDVKRVAVIGAGQMGTGIAQVCAQRGYEVSLCDAENNAAQSARTQIERVLARLVSKGKLEEGEALRASARLESVPIERGAAHAQLVIEAITENLDAKLQLFERLDKLAQPNTLLCSNTSSISITRLAAATGRPGMVAGVHFMNPVPVMKLVEVIKGLSTSSRTMDVVTGFAKNLGKTVVTSKDRPGFIVNRVLIPMLNEACFALSEGVANIEDVDAAITMGLNHPMGPFRLADWIGLDTVLAIAEVLHRDLGEDKYRPNVLLRNLVAAGHLGVKRGRGFYYYDGNTVVGPAL